MTDTRAKRFSALGLGLPLGFPLPEANADIDVQDRYHFLNLYAADFAGSISGVAVVTLPALSQTASGDQTNLTTGAQTLPGLSQTAVGATSSASVIAQTLPSMTQVLEEGADSFYTLPPLEVTHSMVATVDSDDVVMNLPSFTQAAFGGLAGGEGFVVQNLPSLGTVLVGTITDVGAATQTLPSLSQAAVAQQNFFITQTLPSMSQAGFQPVDCWVSGVAVIGDTVSGKVTIQDGFMSKRAEICSV